MPDEPTTKAELLARIDERWAALQALIAPLSPQQLEKPLGDGWSPKVHLAHLAAWERSLTALLLKEDRPSAMGIPADIWAGHDTDALNDVIARHAAPQPLFEVAQASSATHAELLDVLNDLSQEDLERPYSHYQPNDPPYNASPVIGWVHGNTWDHYNEHIGWLEAGLP
jgi:hypothetical protein